MNNNHFPQADNRLLRHFGIILAVAITAIFSISLPWLSSTAMPWWPITVSAALLLCSLAWPQGLHWPYRLWMKLGFILGAINTRVILLIIFAFIIFPTAMVLRIFRVDNLKRRFENKTASYRQKVIPGKSSMEKPY